MIDPGLLKSFGGCLKPRSHHNFLRQTDDKTYKLMVPTMLVLCFGLDFKSHKGLRGGVGGFYSTTEASSLIR